MSQYTLEVQKDYNVSAETVYDAWLDPESVKQFMCPGEGVTVPNPVIDAQVGGQFRFDMQVNPDLVIPHHGVYKVLNRPDEIQFTWVSPNTKNEDSIVTIKIQSTGSQSCTLTLKHELLPTKESRNDHNGGWTRILEVLGQKVAL